MKFQQIRGATSILTYNGSRFLIDPFLAEKGSKPPVKSEHNNLPNPLTALPLPVESIVDVDAVVVTHMHHFDHFDHEAAEAIGKQTPMFTQDNDEAADMRGLGFKNVASLNFQGVKVKDITLIRTVAVHGGEKAAPFYAAKNTKPEASGVVFANPQEKKVYFAGDTIWCAEVEDALRLHKPDVVILNAAEASFADDTPILMGLEGIEAVIKAAPEALLVASHMDAVNHARLGRAELRRFIAEKGLEKKILVPEDGESITI